MSLREQIEKALSEPFDAAAQGLDETEYRGLGVWHNGPTLKESWIKISRELNLESGTFKDGVWTPSPNWDAPTVIDILDETGVKGTGKGNIKDINVLKKRFDNLRKHLPPGDYGMNADHPTKARAYIREWLGLPEFRLSGETARGKLSAEEAARLTKKGIPLEFETMVMTVPPDETPKVYEGPYYDHEQLPKGKEGVIRKKYQALWRERAKAGDTSQINFWVDPNTNLEVPKGTPGAVGFRVTSAGASKTHPSGFNTPAIKRQTYGDTKQRKADIKAQTAPEYLTKEGKKAYKKLWDELRAKGLEVHHTIPLHRARAMFEGLSEAKKIQLLKDWDRLGVRFGNVPGAVEGYSEADHFLIHRTYEQMDGAIKGAGKVRSGPTFFDDLYKTEGPARFDQLSRQLGGLAGGYSKNLRASTALTDFALTGNPISGAVTLAHTSPVQKRVLRPAAEAIGTRIARLTAKRGAMTVGKTVLPVVGDLTIGGLMTYGYLQQGRPVSAAIEAGSTLVGLLPGPGDAASATIDAYQLGRDINYIRRGIGN